MKIAFWSNTHGLCGNSTHVGCISIWYALTHPEAHCAIMENHKTPCGVDRMLYRPLAYERQVYFRSGGLGSLIRHVGESECSLLELEFMAERFIGERLMYFPIGADLGPEQLTYHLKYHLKDLFRLMERQIRHVWIDVSPSSETTRQILDEADRVIVSTVQNKTMLDNLFHNYKNVHEKAFYIIGNYEEESDLTREDIIRMYGPDADRVAVMPRDVGIMDAVSKGMLIPYIMQCYHSEIHEANYPLVSVMRDTVNRVFDWIGEEEDDENDEIAPGFPAMVADGRVGHYGTYPGKHLGIRCETVGI